MQTITSFWNWVDLLFVSAWTYACILDVWNNRYNLKEELECFISSNTEIAYSVVLVLALLKLFFYVRIFKDVGFIIKMIIQGFADLGPFLVIFFAVIGTWTVIFVLYDLNIYGDDSEADDYVTL